MGELSDPRRAQRGIQVPGGSALKSQAGSQGSRGWSFGCVVQTFSALRLELVATSERGSRAPPWLAARIKQYVPLPSAGTNYEE